MRMWLVPPELMCLQHVLGEHLELHMFATSIKKRLDKGWSCKTYFNGKLEVLKLKSRHDHLVNELHRRGHFGHQTPFDWPFEPFDTDSRIDVEESLADLLFRCSACASRIRRFDETAKLQ